ncbi:MAG: hypothetical protein NTW21_21580 [Verrucomicrobia bacterium]|nr:hypothetical protein [Verrucomicrobiota bacterium]
MTTTLYYFVNVLEFTPYASGQGLPGFADAQANATPQAGTCRTSRPRAVRGSGEQPAQAGAGD